MITGRARWQVTVTPIAGIFLLQVFMFTPGFLDEPNGLGPLGVNRTDRVIVSLNTCPSDGKFKTFSRR